MLLACNVAWVFCVKLCLLAVRPYFSCVLFVVHPVMVVMCALHQVHEHAVCDDAALKKLIKQLLAIISRPARLLEVLVREIHS